MTTRQVQRALAIIALALGACVPAHAQDAVDRAIGRPVTAIRFEIEGRAVTADELASLMPIKVGDPLRLDAIRDGESHLVNVGRFDSVQILFTENAAGVDIVVRLTPRHPIDQLQFRGETGLSTGDLARFVRTRFGGIPAREQPQNVAQFVTSLLQDEGFSEAVITHQVETTHNPDRATLVLTISAGPRPVISRTEVTGASPYSRDQIVTRTRTAPGQPFRRAEVEQQLVALEDDLRKAGYFSAVALLAKEPAPIDGGLLVSVLVEAGPKVALEWDGPTPDGDLESLVPLRRQRSVDEDLLEDSDARVATYWRRLGYKDVKVTHTRQLSGDQLTITIHTEPGLKHVVEAVKVSGHSMPEADVLGALNVRAGEPFDEAKLATGIARLTASYRQLGYHRVAITSRDPEEVTAPQTPTVVPVIVAVDIAQGPRAQVGVVSLVGVDPSRETTIRRLLRSTPGAVYVRDAMTRDVIEIDTYYRNLGFGEVTVKAEPKPNPEETAVDVAFAVSEGPQITVGAILVVGNRKVSEESIKDVMILKEGRPLGEAERFESARRISLMGVFQSVSLEEEPRQAGDTVANVLVVVQELPANSWLFGAGVEGGRFPTETAAGVIEDRTFISPRVSFEYGRRNLFGRNRSIDFFVRAAPRPATKSEQDFGFLEYRASTTYREPRAFRSETDITLGIASEQAARTGFNFLRQSGTLQAVRRLSPEVTASARYGLEYTRIFDFNKAIIGEENEFIFQRLFEQVRLSTFSTAVIWDRRDDLVDPGRGTMMSAEAEIAGRMIGSQFGYGKIFLQAMGFHALPTTRRRVVLAGRAQLGLARGFPRTGVEDGVPFTSEDLPVSTRFFAGGSTTVRGFQLDRLGVPELLSENGLSPGGNGVVILNAEVRARVAKLFSRDFSVAGFTDAGNVFPKAGAIDFRRLRAAVGFGIRYNSVLGPIRVDLGFKTERLMMAGQRERGWEYHINIGEAF